MKVNARCVQVAIMAALLLLEVQGLGFRVQGLGFRVLGFGFWVLGLGFRV